MFWGHSPGEVCSRTIGKPLWWSNSRCLNTSGISLFLWLVPLAPPRVSGWDSFFPGRLDSLALSPW